MEAIKIRDCFMIVGRRRFRREEIDVYFPSEETSSYIRIHLRNGSIHDVFFADRDQMERSLDFIDDEMSIT